MARLHRGLLGASTFALVLACAPPQARAESLFHRHDDDSGSERDGIVLQAGVIYSGLRVDEAKLHTLQSVPTPLDGKDLRLDGGSSMTGGMFGAHFVRKGFRLGLIESFAGARGLQLLHGPLADGYTTNTSAWRLGVEIDIGHQFAVGKLSPYADLRLGCSMLAATVQLVDPVKGGLGSTNYTAWAPIIGPRIGVLIPIAKSTVLDLAVTYGLLGHDAAGVSLGIGWAPFSEIAP